MNFTTLTKEEIIEKPIDNDCCGLAFLCGLIKSCGEITLGKNKCIDIIVDYEKTIEKINLITKALYGMQCEFQEMEDLYLNKKTYYRVSIPLTIASEIISDLSTDVMPDVNTWLLGGKISNQIKQNECCRKNFLKGVFMGCATSSIKLGEIASQKTTSGYHLEFTSHNYEFLSEVANMLAQYEMNPKIIARKSVYVLYLKDAEQISNLLAILDATESYLALQNEIIAREMRNQVNRETNCFSANVAKTLASSQKQLRAIETIRQTIGLDSLEPELQEVAILRLANQEESLDELLKLSTINLTKSGIYHRLKKIVKIAENLG